MNLRTLDWLAGLLLIVGGLNWGLVGLFDFNLVAALLGTGILARLIYIIVGLSAVAGLIRLLTSHHGAPLNAEAPPAEAHHHPA